MLGCAPLANTGVQFMAHCIYPIIIIPYTLPNCTYFFSSPTVFPLKVLLPPDKGDVEGVGFRGFSGQKTQNQMTLKERTENLDFNVF